MDNKNFEDASTDFTFDVPSWETEETDTKKVDANLADDAFASTDFGAPTFEDEADVSDAFAGFGMPTQESFAAENSKGNPDTEFSDFGMDSAPIGGFPEGDEFDQTFAREDDNSSAFTGFDSPSDHQTADFTNNGLADAEDALSNGHFIHADAGDPYDRVPVDETETAPAPATASKPLISKLIMPVGIAAIIGVTGFGAYNLLMPGQAPAPAPVVAENKPVENFPASLPGMATAQPQKPVETAQQTPNEAPKPVFGQDASEVPGSLQINLPGTGDADPQLAAPATPSAQTAVTPVASQPVVKAPAPVEQEPALLPQPDQQIATPVAQPETATQVVEVSKAEFDALVARIDGMESDIAAVKKLAESFNNRVEAPAVVTEPSVPAVGNADVGGLNPDASPVASLDSVTPPLKPRLILESSLKGVGRDVAWVKTGTDTREVRVGDDLAAGGKVVSIRKYRGSWIVVTTEGIITQ